MSRTKVKLLRKRIRNLIILAILILCLILVYKIYPQSKSEEIITTNIKYVEELTNQELSILTNSDDFDDNGYYTEMPLYINGLHVVKYSVLDKTKTDENGKPEVKKFYPGDKYYFTEEEISSGQTTINVEYDKRDSQKDLYYKKLETRINQSSIVIEGYMPKDAEIIINMADFKNTEDKIKAVDEKLNLTVAYDIKIMSKGEKYEPNKFDENVRVTILGIVDQESNIGLKVIHITDDDKIEEVKTVSIAEENLSFNAESFSTYAIVSPSVELFPTQDWDGNTIANEFTWGSGSAADPYLISSGAELAFLANEVNDGTLYAGSYFKLINNINLNNNAWIPIGTRTNSFRGQFDGQGFTISNAIITVNVVENGNESYGIFGSLNGSSATNNAIIKNVVFDNIQLGISMSNLTSSNYNYKIGIVTGSVYRYTRIENVIVKNSSINNNGWYNISADCYPTFFIGGIVGEAAYSSTNNTSNVSASASYVINKCYSDVDISFGMGCPQTIQLSKMSIGGIIGRISRHNIWPTNCLYNGSILNGQATMNGPIFGGETISDTTIATTIPDLNTYMWNGNTTSTMTSYYTNYTAIDKTYTSTCITGNTPNTTDYRGMEGPYWNSYIWGVNKGIYTTALGTTILEMFNRNASDTGLCTWEYDDGDFKMVSGLDIEIKETSSELYTFTITPQSALENPTYTYNWYVNGTLDTTRTTNATTFEPSFVSDRLVQVMVSDGTNVTLGMFNLQQLTLNVTIELQGQSLVPVFTGTGVPLARLSEYTLNWYEIDVINGTKNELQTTVPATGSLSGLKLHHEYRLELTNGYEGVETLTANYIYANRNVIYVNNVNYQIEGVTYYGNNNNLGATPQTAVQTLTRAYQLIAANFEVEGNIIVIMGNYTNTDFLDVRGGNQNSYNEAAGKFNKPALITGKYKGTNYNANLNFQCQDNIYNGRYLFGDIRFEHIIFNGNNGRTFFYLQGHDIVMGENINMVNYQAIDNSDFGQIRDLGSPSFNMFCGFHNYNYSRIPDASKVSNVTIRSGVYGRVVAGCRNNTGADTVITTSHNMFGTGVDGDFFECNINIDYINQPNAIPDINLLVAGSTDGNMFSHSTINLSNGKVARILGGNIGSNTVTYENYPSNLFVGSTTINMTGGDVTEIYGGSLGRWTNVIHYYGEIEINISGGTIRSALYGAGGAAITGNNTSSPYSLYDEFVEDLNITTSVEINISGGDIFGNIYGGGYGYSSYLGYDITANNAGSLYGNSTINITGGTIGGNIYGAGRGFDYANRPELAQMVGNSTIQISNSPTITGKIYGAGEGVSGKEGIAKLIGNSNITIASNIGTEIYGGGHVSNVEGNAIITLTSGNYQGTIYGGGENGNITGNTTITKVAGNTNTIYGGGYMAPVTGSSTVNINGGTNANVFGGGNQATVTNSIITINNGTTTNVYGGGNQATVENSDIQIKGGTTTNIYGGGNQAGAGITEVYLKGGTATSIFGGSNRSGTVNESNIILQTGSATNVYGGNNQGGNTVYSNMYIYGGTITENLYGGGNQASIGTTNVHLKNTTSVLGNIYGGGNQAGATETNIYLEGGNATNVFGGSNQSGTVAESNIYIGNEPQHIHGYIYTQNNNSTHNKSCTCGELIENEPCVDNNLDGICDLCGNEIQSYSITFNANYGSGGPTTQTKLLGRDLQISNLMPTRNNYVFAGWSTNSSATISTYKPGDIFTTDADTTLYAVWEDKRTYSYQRVTSITSGEKYLIVFNGMYAANNTYRTTAAGYAGLGYFRVDLEDAAEDAAVISISNENVLNAEWQFVSSGSGYVITNVANGQYLNLSTSGTPSARYARLSTEAQTHNVTMSSNQFRIGNTNGSSLDKHPSNDGDCFCTYPNGSNIYMQIYKKIYPTMSGTTAYTYQQQVGNETNILNNIKANTSILEKNGDETLKTIDWQSHYVTYSWNIPFNANSIGTYVLSVYYDGIKLGDVTVNITIAQNSEVATYNGINYTTVQAAVDAAGTNEATIKLIADCIQTITIGVTQNITLDLNGKTISSAATVITNNGNLIVTDNTAAGTGRIVCTGNSNAYYPIIHRSGNLVLNKGNLVGAYRGISVENNGGTFEMNGGSITSNGGSSITSQSTGKFEMNGGTINSSSYGVYLYRSTDVKITDGIINGGNAALYIGNNITVDIGKQDTIVNSIPALKSTSTSQCAIQATNSTINFYDGVLRGIYGAYSGTLGAKESGAVISTSTETISGTTYNVARVERIYEIELPTSVTQALTITNVYGGNNVGGATTESNIIGYEGTITNIFGGGNNVNAQTTNIIINEGDNYTNIYGGSNASGTVTETHVNIFGGTITNVYGGNNSGGFTTTSNVTLTDGTVTNIFGGNDRGGTTTNTNVMINGGTVEDVYGGNNEGGTTTNANTTTNNGIIGNVFGGGYQAATNNVVLNISSPISRNVYGGGNLATVNNNTIVNLINATIGNSVYGGGNEGIVSGNTTVNVKNSEIMESVYGGGNGTAAVVNGNTTVALEGTTNIHENAFAGGNQAATGIDTPNPTSVSTINIVGATIRGNVYGGANMSVIYGSTNVNIGNSVPNISDLTIGNIEITGSVFGGGERSLGYADYQAGIYCVKTGVEINIDAYSSTFLISGSIFGSGNKVNSSGASNINIKNYGMPESPKNSKSIQRATTVVLDNSSMWILGAKDSTNKYVDTNYSLSRIGELKLKNNSVIYLASSTNLLEKLSSVVDNGLVEEKGAVTINNGVITSNVNNRIYMYPGVNLNIAKNETVTDYGDVYGMAFLGLYTGNNSIALGIYSNSYTQNDEIDSNDLVGFYSTSYVLAKHQYTNETSTHDITEDGFYTNYEEESEVEGDPSTIKVDYITPIPDNQYYYMWKVGKDGNVKEYNIELTASKYNTLGIKKLRLTDFTSPGAIFEYSGIICDFPEGVELIDRTDINDIETDPDKVHTKFGLKVSTRKTGWSEQASSYYYSSPLPENNKYYKGDTVFVKDSEDEVAPILNFNLYHAQNITDNIDNVGTANLFFTAIEQPDDPAIDPNKKVTPIIIHVKIKTSYSSINNYEVSTAPGEYYEAFGSDDTYITNKSEFSQYYSLTINDFDRTEYYDTYDTNYRTLVSSVTLPENTIVTMMDITQQEGISEYYYYTVPAGGVTEIDIADFKKMGSAGLNSSDMFDEDNDKYYNSITKVQHEKFIFKFDFSNAEITNNIVDETILLAYREAEEDETLISVWDDLTETFTYSVYVANSDIDVDVDPLEDSSIYLGEEVELNIDTSFNKTRIGGRTIDDTKYFKLKPGIKMTVYTGEYDNTYNYETDPNSKQVTGSSLLGVYYEWVPLVEGNSINYYPRADGTTRIKTAGLVGPVATNVKIHTENSNLHSGNYTIKVEAFASPDGIYYGLESDAVTFINISVANSIYGLLADLENDNMVIIESETGKTQNKIAGEERSLKFDIQYSSGLLNPNIRVGLYRRDYENQYSYTYNLVDLEDYVTNALTESNISDIYRVTDSPTSNMDFDLTLRNPDDPEDPETTDLVTGTYKVVFSLYDGDTYIGEVYQYIVIN